MNGFDEMIANIKKLQANAHIGARHGAEDGADLIEVEIADTNVYAGMSGATRASSLAYVATASDPNDIEPISAFNTAEGLLANFTGHEGQAMLGDVAGPGESELWVVATVPTDYVLDLVVQRDDFLSDAIHGQGPAAFQAIADGIKQEWHL
jgi:hypothetical protein